MESVKELKHRNRIFGEPFTINELVDLVAELEIGESSHSFEGSEEDVVTQVVDKVYYEEGVKMVRLWRLTQIPMRRRKRKKSAQQRSFRCAKSWKR